MKANNIEFEEHDIYEKNITNKSCYQSKSYIYIISF